MQRRTLISEVIELFFFDCEIKRLKPNTLRFYQAKLQNLASFCNANSIEYVNDISSKTLKDFSISLIKRRLSEQYQHNILRAVRAFLNFCVTDELLVEAPKITFPKLPKEVKKALSSDEIKAVLSACRNERDKLIILLFLDSGLRNNELCSLDSIVVFKSIAEKDEYGFIKVPLNLDDGTETKLYKGKSVLQRVEIKSAFAEQPVINAFTDF